MRKLKLQMNMSMDGFVAGPEGELDWMQGPPDEKQLQILSDLTGNMDTILMGRKMASGFTQYWEDVVNNQPGSPEYEYAKIFVDTPKIVFSKSTGSVPGKNVTVENGDLVEAVNKLKKQPGKDLIVYGGANFVSELLRNSLIDELYLFISPTAIANGLKLFSDRLSFNLVRSEVFTTGVIANVYTRKD